MTTNDKMNSKGEIILYKADDGSTQIDVKMKDETVWLSQKQMSLLFDKDVRTINEHMKNVYKEGELKPKSTIRKFRIVQKEGKRSVEREIEFYNLDVIISIGYRVKSQRGTQFRIWATNVLKQHLLKGFTLHSKRLEEKGLTELQQTIDLVRQTSDMHELSASEATGILHVITSYMQTWILLRQYDEGELVQPTRLRKAQYRLTYNDARNAFSALKAHLEKKNEASELFGLERGHALESILGNVEQTFDKKDLYPTLEEKAAHLLYFVIKDHPFSDGNKRIGVLLFLHFLNCNNALPSGNNALQNSTLVSLALLIAESAPKQKEIMLQMILQFLTN